MDTFGIFGFMFGLVGFTTAIAAMRKVTKLEAELKRRGALEKDFSAEK